MEYKISDKLAALKPSAIREIFKSLTDPTIISFAAGNPNPLSFPVEAISELSADIFAKSAPVALQYGMTEGYIPLRQAVAERMRDRFGIGRSFDTTIITTGGQQGIELTCKALCNEGDAVICENPSFIGALNAFRSNGARTVGVPLNDDGIDVEKLEAVLKSEKRAKILYLIPTFHNPAGITSTLENRQKVYALAKEYGIVILEDNPYGELRFAGTDVPTYKSFDEDGIVVYCSSFSKILSSGMRVGFVCGPEALVSKMIVAKQVEDVHTNLFFQMLCHRYMTEYDLDGHIAGIRDLYRSKCNRMLAALDRELPSCIKYTRPEGGLFLWCTLPDGQDSAPFVKAALAQKVAVVPGSAFNCDENAPSDSFRLNYSMPSDEDIDRGVAILGKLAKEMF
ncbi:MAG: PLP-dependent aminotransferase family protein [Ruminococcaceae bacterium]|nr:PLP-dependent aminotransferase family protein [Oscillospiraceae bacterium]